MQGFRPAAEAEVVLAFLRGELGSARFAADVRRGLAEADAVDDLIVMATPGLGELIVLEGHARLTAIFVGGLQRRLTVRGYLGVSAATDRWSCY